MGTETLQEPMDGSAIISEHEKISVGQEWHSINHIEDDTIIAEIPDGSPVYFDRSQLSRCDCGILVLGDRPCIDCDDLNWGR